MNLEKYIPFETKKFRPYQKEVIESIINKIDDGVETILLNAPVGVSSNSDQLRARRFAMLRGYV